MKIRNFLQERHAIKAVITLFAFFASVNGFTQSQTKTAISFEQQMEGTYEIISNGKVTEIFTTEILKEIDKRRDDSKEILYEVSKYTTIRILPRSVINSPEFLKPKQD